MTDAPHPPARSPAMRFFGGALMAVGAMLAVLCGGCGVVFLVGFGMDMVQHPSSSEASFLLLPIFLGGVPAAIGLGLFIAGRGMRRGPRP